MSMFGAIVSGRAVQTDFQQVDTTRFLITITDADSVNHIVVFLTGAQALPIGYGAAVFFSWPDPNIPPTWQYLGFISNEKPSAIFKITKLKTSDNAVVPNIFGYTQPIVSHVAQIGISVEPLLQIQQMTPDSSVSPTTGNSFITYATKTAESLFNYVMSFGRAITPDGNEQFVPVSSIQQWFENYMRKLQQDPNFWKN